MEVPAGPATRDEATTPESGRTPLSPLFRTPLLRPEFETALFRRMNYLKYRAARRRNRLDPLRPLRPLLDEIEGLLAEADRCRDTLVESNLRLVAAVARKLAGSVLDFEELLSEGNIILVHTVDKFDFSRGFRFSTYAVTAIQRHLYRVIANRQRLLRREQSADIGLLEGIVSGPENELPPSISLETIHTWMAGLDARSQSILCDRYGLRGTGEKRTFKSIAADIGLSKESVRQLQNRAIAKLRESVGEDLATLEDGEQARSGL